LPQEVVSQLQQHSTTPIQKLNVSDADNRNVLLGFTLSQANAGTSRLRPNAWQSGLDSSYNAFAPRQYVDEVKYGNVKADGVNKVKQKYGYLSDEQISEILALGAPTRTGAFGERVTPAERAALKDVATRHYVRIEPDLNAKATAQLFLNRKRAEAREMEDLRAIQKWDNMDIFEEDLDGKKETPDNLIIRNKNDAADLYAIDGLRFVGREKAMMKRAIYEDYPGTGQIR
jgi:hypothetical protein